MFNLKDHSLTEEEKYHYLTLFSYVTEENIDTLGVDFSEAVELVNLYNQTWVEYAESQYGLSVDEEDLEEYSENLLKVSEKEGLPESLKVLFEGLEVDLETVVTQFDRNNHKKALLQEDVFSKLESKYFEKNREILKEYYKAELIEYIVTNKLEKN